ncbi:unnamed protein product [Ilex paraguariensis]|uniref:Uncharacterized protein n=1 Tax=Ilex paraguariensis TaxID=185542 RepID=A0ABC8SFC9_9AQUA
MSCRLSNTINNELASLSSTPFEPYIFRVDGPLRRENVKAYEPEMLAIGPYHHGKSNLKMMEEHKLRVDGPLRRENVKAYEPEMLAIGPYHHGKSNLKMMEEYKLRNLQLLLKRRNESSVDRYVNAMQDLEEKTRKSYAESIGLGKDEFVRMMLFDGSTIIELFRKFEDGTYEDDPIFKLDKFGNILRRDLLLFENQLPFFVLVLLFDMTNNPNQERNIFSSTLMFFAQFTFNRSSVPSHDVDHVLGLVYESWCSSFAATLSSRGNFANQGIRWEFIKCSTDLREAGIKFEKATESSSLMDIKFENGIIKIPPLRIGDSTEIAFRNMIAYEQYKDRSEPAYVTHYVMFFNCLVNTPKDAEILHHRGIIDNWLGNDEAVSTMLNKLGNNIVLDETTFCYSEVFNKVNEHCKRRRHIWMAKLRRNYFNSPWSVISLFGVTLLLLLTIIQTICSVLQVS